MSAGMWKVVEVNPNDVTGGSGCLCDEVEGRDTKGPFVAFISQDMDSNLSPTPVLCAGCARQCVEELDEFDGQETPEL